MDMNGEQLIPLPRQRVWEALNDPETLKRCIPCLLYTSPSPRD